MPLSRGRSAASGPRRPVFRHPAQIIASAFAGAITVGTALLSLPIARTGPGSAELPDALFTATSAVCVTGLVTVDTPTYWSGFGQGVILALIQVGGFGIMTLASLIGVLLARRLGLRSRLTAAAETKSLGLGDVRRVLVGVFRVSLLFEAVTAVLLTARFVLGYDMDFWSGLYHGVFHAVSSFNNAGFALYSDNMMGFATDPWICLPICLAIIVGGLGFPVLIELRREYRRPRQWSLHTKLTVGGYFWILLAGFVFVTASEWGNPGTLGAFDAPGRLLAGFFQAVNARTAGFNNVDYAEMNEGTLLGTDILMFIGGGSAGTAGGIKVTTFLLLFFVIWTEVRGEEDVHAGDRRIGERVQRQALTVALIAIGVIAVATLTLLEMTDLGTDEVLFEVVSAFATVGLSTGITADLPTSGQMVLVALMFIGRLGPITLVSALALRERQRRYSLPEGRPLIG